MTATRDEVRSGIQDVLRSVDGLDNVYAFQPMSPTPPAAIVPLFGYDPQAVLSGSAWNAQVPVLVLVGTGDMENADRQLAALQDPIVDAFNDSPSLGISGVDCIVSAVGEGQIISLADTGVLYYSVTFTLDVLAS